VRAARWAPLSGIVFVILWLVAFALMGDEDRNSSSEVLSWYADSGNRHKQIAAFFVVLAASPLDDIRNVRRVELVVASGRRYQPAELRK
jgi:hypothetical protein